MADAQVPASLVRDVGLLCLDAGNTVIFLDHARLARLIGERVEAGGHVVDAGVLVRAEGRAKRLAEEDGLFDFPWNEKAKPGASGWGRMIGTILRASGIPDARVPALVESLWREHRALNLWSLVPAGLGAALDRIRARGVKVAIVSNSEGMLEGLFADLGILSHFDLLVDSGKVGVEKPDPRIFQHALRRFDVAPERALHLGDMFATDVLGARAAGLRVALIDPHGHYEGVHLDVARVPGAVEVAHAIFSE